MSVVLFVVASPVLLTGTPAHADLTGDPRMYNQARGRCLDADLGTIDKPGSRIMLWDCSGGDNQKRTGGTRPQEPSLRGNV
ncbi:hypothetical protein Acor_15410 [Acrocarpospora corrugata]|uniref:Ricin B lectin domain-containing protein n=1 Tax=Acrocarpospora corrugata TaxID=35763 RepID=A0A5M3VYM5_9ACTN|nr:hypothetical protein Acor_15410 [Acrocarpospora corrugata]